VDQLFVGVLGCPRSLPDPWALADLLPAALEELEREALGPLLTGPS